MRDKVAQRVQSNYRKRYASLTAKRLGNSNSDIKVIAVAGTVGKATTANYLREMLDEAGQTVRLLTPTLDESLSVRRVQDFLREARKTNTLYAIVVVDTPAIEHYVFGSAPLELVVVTSTSDDDYQTIAKLLGTAPRYSVLNRDDDHFEALAELPVGAQSMTYGVHEEAEAYLEKASLYRGGSEARIVIDHQTKLKLATYLLGTANIYNLTAAVTCLYVMGESIMSVDEGAARLEAMPENFAYIPADAPYKIILDSAPTPASLQSVADSAKQLTRRRLLVALQADVATSAIIDHIATLADRVAVVDVNDQTRSQGTIERVVSPDAAIKLVLRGARQGDTVLLAGPIFARPEEDDKTYAEMTVENTL